MGPSEYMTGTKMIPSMLHVCRESLIAMKRSLQNNYYFDTVNCEQELLLKAFSESMERDTVLSTYKSNEGKRRLYDVIEIIDSALERIDACESRDEASKIYIDALKSVALVQRWTKILERSTM